MNMIKNITIWLCCLAGIGLVSCSNEQEKMLCKAWQVSDVVFVNESQSLVQSDTLQGNMQEVTKTLITDVLKKNIHVFNDDGTYLTGNAVAKTEGKWELEGKSIRFITEKEGKKTDKIIPIEKLLKDTLILLMKNDQSSMQMKLILTPLQQ
jgi:hypothetical protein